MASIIKKRKGGHVYYYAAECQRVEGKPRIVWQKYLGKLDDIVRRLEQGPLRPVSAEIFSFGAVAALWSIARRLRLVEIIDEVVPKRDQGPSVGEYMLIAAINRAVEPRSKRQIGEWFESTSLRRLLPHIQPRQLSSQRFWDHMDRLERESIRKIERLLVDLMVQEFQLDLRAVIYDTTNFLCYIDTANEAELPQRGASKAKRFDLKQVGLALLVALDFHVPLFHEPYPGNQHDSEVFAGVIEELTERYRLLAKHCEGITLILDKGNNSHDNQAHFSRTGYHFVGSLVPSHHPELLQVPKSHYRPLGGPWTGHRAYRTQKEVFGKPCTVMVVYNEALYLGQIQGLSAKLKKATQNLREISQRLDQRRQAKVARGKPPTVESVQAQVRKALKGEQLDRLIRTQVREVEGFPQLHFELDPEALHRLAQERFGKTILFTDQHAWSEEEILAAYRGQYQVEHAFRQMKDPQFVSWRPMFHWTDQKIRVHAFYCVLALTLAALLLREVHRRAAERGVPPPASSISDLLETLAEIREVAHLYPPEARVQDHITWSERTPRQQQLFDLLDLDRFAPATQ